MIEWTTLELPEIITNVDKFYIYLNQGQGVGNVLGVEHYSRFLKIAKIP